MSALQVPESAANTDKAHTPLFVTGRAKTSQGGALKTGQCCGAYTSSV
jgi:hypothetical protein